VGILARCNARCNEQTVLEMEARKM